MFKLWLRHLSVLTKGPFKTPALPLRFTFWRRFVVLFIVLESSNWCHSHIVLLMISLKRLITWCMRQRCATASVNSVVKWLIMLSAWGHSPQIGFIYRCCWLLIASIHFDGSLVFLIVLRGTLLQDSVFGLLLLIWFFILLVTFTLGAINYLNKVTGILCILLLELFTILTLGSFSGSTTKWRTLVQIPCSIAHRMLILIISSKHASRDSVNAWRLPVEGQGLWELPFEFSGAWLSVIGAELGTHWVVIVCCSTAWEVWHASLAHMSRSSKLSLVQWRLLWCGIWSPSSMRSSYILTLAMSFSIIGSFHLVHLMILSTVLPPDFRCSILQAWRTSPVPMRLIRSGTNEESIKVISFLSEFINLHDWLKVLHQFRYIKR